MMNRSLMAIVIAAIGAGSTISAKAAENDAEFHSARHGSTSPMLELNNSGRMPGGADYSTLQRGRNSVRVEMNTSGVDPATAYTLWAVIFNSPRHCSAIPCGPADLPTSPGHDPAVQASLVYVTGGYSGNDSRLRLMAQLHEPSNGIKPTESIYGPGLLDSRRAEIHFIVRGHGPNPGSAPFAIGSFNAGCTDANPCGNHQSSVHLGR